MAESRRWAPVGMQVVPLLIIQRDSVWECECPILTASAVWLRGSGSQRTRFQQSHSGKSPCALRTVPAVDCVPADQQAQKEPGLWHRRLPRGGGGGNAHLHTIPSSGTCWPSAARLQLQMGKLSIYGLKRPRRQDSDCHISQTGGSPSLGQEWGHRGRAVVSAFHGLEMCRGVGLWSMPPPPFL